MIADVIILGAGISGLACALAVRKNGLTPPILDADDAIGGRVRTDKHGAFLLDRGFQVYLDDKPIGKHSFRISESGETRRISSSASFDVDFLFVNAYRYRHSSSEIFRDGCLQEIRATTDDNGKRYRVEGSALGKGFRVEHQDGVEQAHGCLTTFAYWDPDFLRQKRLLNAQTGDIERG